MHQQTPHHDDGRAIPLRLRPPAIQRDRRRRRAPLRARRRPAAGVDAGGHPRSGCTAETPAPADDIPGPAAMGSETSSRTRCRGRSIRRRWRSWRVGVRPWPRPETEAEGQEELEWCEDGRCGDCGSGGGSADECAVLGSREEGLRGVCRCGNGRGRTLHPIAVEDRPPASTAGSRGPLHLAGAAGKVQRTPRERTLRFRRRRPAQAELCWACPGPRHFGPPRPASRV